MFKKFEPDKFIEELVGMGLPGIILLVLIVTSPYSGAAAITWALAALGPFGIVGGLVALPVLYYFGRWSAKQSTEAVVKKIVNEARKQGFDKQKLQREMAEKKLLPKWIKEKVLEVF